MKKTLFSLVSALTLAGSSLAFASVTVQINPTIGAAGTVQGVGCEVYLDGNANVGLPDTSTAALGGQSPTNDNKDTLVPGTPFNFKVKDCVNGQQVTLTVTGPMTATNYYRNPVSDASNVDIWVATSAAPAPIQLLPNNTAAPVHNVATALDTITLYTGYHVEISNNVTAGDVSATINVASAVV